MKTAAVRRLRRDLGTILTQLETGEAVGIGKGGKIVALLSPPPVTKRAKPRRRPDFLGRLKRIYGNKVLHGDAVMEERSSRPY